WVALVGLVEHTAWDGPGWPGALNASASSSALAGGAGIGLVLSYILWRWGVFPTSFADGGPLLQVEKAARAEEIARARKEGHDEPLPPREYTRAEIRIEMRKEMLFLLPPLVLGLAWMALTWRV